MKAGGFAWAGRVGLAWLFLVLSVSAQLKVLFIGNSFTYAWGAVTSVPDLFDRLARAGGQQDPIVLMRQIGGADFEQHSTDPDTLAAIDSQPWTHVVLQNYSTEPTHLTPNDGRSIADHLTFGRALYQQIIANNSATKVVLFETWSRAASNPIITGTSTNTTFESTTQFQAELRANYRLLRDDLNNEFPDNPLVRYSPVGDAWEAAGALLPLNDPDFLGLFKEDEVPYGYHPNDRGAYLAACVFYSKIYGVSPVGLHSDPLIVELNLNFDSNQALFLESTAWQTVLDDIDPVSILAQPSSVTVPEGHPVVFQASITGEPPFAVQWKKDGVPIAGATGLTYRIPAAWSSMNGAQFSADIANEISSVTTASATLTVAPAAAYSVFLDFGSIDYPTSNGAAPNDPARYWNNILPSIAQTSDGVVDGLVTDQNGATLLGFEMLSRFNDAGPNGTNAPVVDLPANATLDYLWGNTEDTGGLSNVFPEFRITGLAPSWDHRLTFFASRTGVSSGDNRDTVYDVSGVSTDSVHLNPSNNTTNVAVLDAVSSSASGQIDILLTPGTANNSTGHYTYLNSLQIDATPGPAPSRTAMSTTVNGSGAIVLNPSLADYAPGEFVELSAVPDPGWVFSGWSGDASGSDNPAVVAADADPNITATFELQNTAPTITPIADQIIDEDHATAQLAFTIGDIETNPDLLVVNGYSSDPSIVGGTGISLSTTGANRTVEVTPLPNAYGTVNITITVSDGELETDEVFLLTVNPVDDDDPLAAADALATDEDVALNGDVSSNDTVGVDGGTYSEVSPPTHGALSLAADGTFLYTPALNYNGGDAFTCRITDSDGETSDATATITVNPVDDDDPLAAADDLATDEDVPLNGDVSSNDTVGVDGGTYSEVSPPTHGTLSLAADGTFLYTPALNYNGADSFTYRITDSDGETSDATATITVLSDAPPGFDEWLAGFGLTGDPGDDSDHGGRDNLNEFIFNFDPSDPKDDKQFQFTFDIGGGSLEVHFRALKPIGDYHLYVADNPSGLGDPSNLVETVTKNQIELMTEAERANYTFVMPYTKSRGFIRIAFELN